MGLNLFKRPKTSAEAQPLGFEEWLSYFSSGGFDYPLLHQTLIGDRETIGNDFCGYVRGAFKTSGPVAAVILARLALFSDARLTFRQRGNGRPGKLFGTPALAPLEHPWPGGTTGDLMARAELDVSLAGNFFAARRIGSDRITRLRPDWTHLAIGLPDEPADDEADTSYLWHPDAEVLGYIYHPGGPNSGQPSITYRADEVAHYAPIPDPERPFCGISWLTPVLTEILGDKAMSRHRQRFFENGATPNMIVKSGISDDKKFDAWVKRFRAGSEGSGNAYRTLVLMAGADATVVGADLKQLDFRTVQGGGESRIASAGGVPAVVVGFSEGLQGSSLNAGNYESAVNRFANLTIRWLWRNFCGSMATIIDVPDDAELWTDDRDIAALQAAEKDRADAVNTKAQSIRTLVDGGFTPDSAVLAVAADDITLLVHSGLTSVQLLPPGAQNGNGNGSVALARRQAET